MKFLKSYSIDCKCTKYTSNGHKIHFYIRVFIIRCNRFSFHFNSFFIERMLRIHLIKYNLVHYFHRSKLLLFLLNFLFKNVVLLLILLYVVSLTATTESIYIIMNKIKWKLWTQRKLQVSSVSLAYLHLKFYYPLHFEFHL